jgi:hypothetical protein
MPEINPPRLMMFTSNGGSDTMRSRSSLVRCSVPDRHSGAEQNVRTVCSGSKIMNDHTTRWSAGFLVGTLGTVGFSGTLLGCSAFSEEALIHVRYRCQEAKSWSTGR